ncbi:MAG: hypothetical protein ABI634_12755 [Acidobacteriota bacterium]
MAKKTTNAKSSDIAAALGELSKKVSNWKEERTLMTRELQRLAELTGSMLRELGEVGAPTSGAGTRRGGRPRGYKTSAATRAKLRAAWRRRKEGAGGTSKAAKSGTGKRTMSAEARARIAEAQRKRWAAARAGK